jgi:hypothetical protein
MSQPSPPLIEGVDYYIEAGRWVFTAAFHRKRGYCCGNGCRHCPYGNAPADLEQTSPPPAPPPPAPLLPPSQPDQAG